MTYKINIEKPCSENWNEMSANEQGRFCLKCNKTVQDFSNLTDKELIQFLKSSKGGICAKTTINQLNRDLIPRDKSINVFRKYYRIVAGIFLINIPQFVIAQTNKEKVEVSPISTKNTDSTQNTVVEPSKYIKGIVVDSATNWPLIGVTLKLNNKRLGTDIDGKFIIKLENTDSDTSHIRISYLGYKSQILSLNSFDKDNTVIKLVEKEPIDETLILGGIMHVEVRKKWWQFWK